MKPWLEVTRFKLMTLHNWNTLYLQFTYTDLTDIEQLELDDEVFVPFIEPQQAGTSTSGQIPEIIDIHESTAVIEEKNGR